MKSLLAAVLTLSLSTTVASAQGVVIQLASREFPSGKETPSGTIYIQGGIMREDDVDGSGHVTGFSIIRNSVMWMVDTEARTYQKIDKASMQQAAATIKAMMEGMKTRMANMPPERRAMMQQMMDRYEGKAAPAPGSAITFVDAGKDETSGSYTCHIWEMRLGDEAETQYCVVPWSSVPGGDQAEAAWKEVMATMRDMISEVPFPGLAKEMDERSKMFVDPHGFPVMTRHMESGQPLSEDVVTSIEEQSIPADRFEIPKGYEETSPLKDIGGMGPDGR